MMNIEKVWIQKRFETKICICALVFLFTGGSAALDAQPPEELGLLQRYTGLAVVEMIPSGGDPLFATSPAGNYLYISSRDRTSDTPSGTHLFEIVDANTHTLLGSLALTGGLNIGSAITPDGSLAYLAVSRGASGLNGDNRVDVIDVSTPTEPTLVTSFPVVTGPTHAVITPDGSTVFMSARFSNVVIAIDVASNSVLTNIPVGIVPVGLALTSDGSELYVANSFSRTVSVIDTSSFTVSRTIAHSLPLTLSSGRIAIGPDEEKAYVISLTGSRIAVLDLIDGTEATTIPTDLLHMQYIAVDEAGVVFVTHSTGLTLFDVSDPASPTFHQPIHSIPIDSAQDIILAAPNEAGVAAYVTTFSEDGTLVIGRTSQPFTCTTGRPVVAQDGVTQLFEAEDVQSSALTLTAIGDPSGIEYNGLGFRNSDGFLAAQSMRSIRSTESFWAPESDAAPVTTTARPALRISWGALSP